MAQDSGDHETLKEKAQAAQELWVELAMREQRRHHVELEGRRRSVLNWLSKPEQPAARRVDAAYAFVVALADCVADDMETGGRDIDWDDVQQRVVLDMIDGCCSFEVMWDVLEKHSVARIEKDDDDKKREQGQAPEQLGESTVERKIRQSLELCASACKDHAQKERILCDIKNTLEKARRQPANQSQIQKKEVRAAEAAPGPGM